jgi:Na+/melibiose symporter-like transporter
MNPQQPPVKASEASCVFEEKGAHDGHKLTERSLSSDDRDTTPTVNTADDGQPPSAEAEDSPRRDSDAESVGGQRNAMTTKRLMIAIPALSVCLFVSFVDQTSVSTATPAIAQALDTGTATSWIGTSFLIASTAFQLINGRLSDIFGRKNLLLICLALMGLGDLGCGFAQTANQLFALRSIAGIGGGGINSLVMIIVSDITTLQNRGKYQGMCDPSASLLSSCTNLCVQVGWALLLHSPMALAHSSEALWLKVQHGDGCSG